MPVNGVRMPFHGQNVARSCDLCPLIHAVFPLGAVPVLTPCLGPMPGDSRSGPLPCQPCVACNSRSALLRCGTPGDVEHVATEERHATQEQTMQCGFHLTPFF